jgi:HK97 family phage major capsid protein
MKQTLDNRGLRELRSHTLKEAKALSAKGGKLNAADQKRFDELMQEADELREQIAAIEGRGSTLTVLGGGPINGFENRQEDPKQREHRRAFASYLRMGVAQMDPEQRSVLQEFRDMGTGGQGAYPGATAGFFVPVGFMQDIVSALKYYGPFLDPGICRIMDTATGQPLPYPTEDDVSVLGERVAEGQQVTDQDVNIGQLMLGAYKYSSRMVKVSIELLQDSAFDLESFLIQAFAKRIGRILNSDFTTGLGTASMQPMGLLSATAANGNIVSAIGSSGNDGTSASTNTIGSDDLVNLEHSVDVLYRPGASYMAHDSTWKAVRKVKDKFGRPLWEKSLVAGQPDTINGYPMLTNNSMPTLQVNTSSPQVTVNSVIFGDMKRYLVRRVRDLSILVLRERFADFGQVAYICFARYDATPLYAGTDAFPFGLLQNSY